MFEEATSRGEGGRPVDPVRRVCGEAPRPAIPNDNGPDLFIFAHERVGRVGPGAYRAATRRRRPTVRVGKLLFQKPSAPAVRGPTFWPALTFQEARRWFYNRALVKAPPATTDELLSQAQALQRAMAVRTRVSGGQLFITTQPVSSGGGHSSSDGASPHSDSAGAIAFFSLRPRAGRAEESPGEPDGFSQSRGSFNEAQAAMVHQRPLVHGERIDFARSTTGLAPLPRSVRPAARPNPLLHG